MPLHKDEGEVVRKLLVPILKEKFFVRTSVRMDKIYQKLHTEGVLSQEEMSVRHTFHPDIDILYWNKDYTQEPTIHASEVKYFRIREGKVYPNIYEGIGEAMMLLTFGFDHVSLWHLFDPEIPSETVTLYEDLTKSLLNDVSSPINYQSWLVSVLSVTNDKETKSVTSADYLAKSVNMFTRSLFLLAITSYLKSNPLVYRIEPKIMRAIIKKYYRMVK